MPMPGPYRLKQMRRDIIQYREPCYGFGGVTVEP